MSIASDFKKFALRGSIVDLTIGFTVGAAFTTIVKSFVNDILMPPVGLLTGQTDFADKFVVLKEGAKTAPYATLAEAQAAGAVTMNYGIFINNMIAFTLVALAVFLLVRLINRIDDAMQAEVNEAPAPEDPPTKKCTFCLSNIAYKATRCPACTSQLPASVGASSGEPGSGI